MELSSMRGANFLSFFAKLIIPDSTIQTTNVNIEVQSIVNVSLKVPVRKPNRIQIVAFAKSKIKRQRFIRLFMCFLFRSVHIVGILR